MKFLKATDRTIYDLIKLESRRQLETLQMIPSENHTSQAVMEALGSKLTNKYSEGFPKKRYYQGNTIIDSIEILAQDRAKKLFGVPYVNVQALSGSPANSAVYLAVLKNGEKMMGLDLSSGGHITHGNPIGLSGRLFKVAHYKLSQDEILDYDAIEKQVLAEKPQLLICGYTAYPRVIDFERFGKIADKANCYLMADVSHIAGLIVGDAHPSPVPYAHIITTTTHKTLRGPRGALIMVTDKGLKKDPDLPKKIESAIIPGLQGGPHDNQTAAIAVALLEDSTPAFKRYAKQIVKNAQTLADELKKYNFKLVSNGTENHLILIDLRNKGVNGRVAAVALEAAGIVTNMNGVPGDTMPPLFPSGVRLGTPALTTRGMKTLEMKQIARWINEVIEEVRDLELPADRDKRREIWKQHKKQIMANRSLARIARDVKKLCVNFPV